MTRRGFFALAFGLVPVRASAQTAALVGVLVPQPGDGRLFTIGRHWTLIADPEASEYTVAAVRELEQTTVAVTLWADRVRAL